jgi:hypothetical protein
MENKSGSKKYLVSDTSKPWYRAPGVLIMVTLSSTIIWFIGTNYVALQLDIKPKLLILRSEGCAYVQLHHIQTRPYPIEHTCSAEVPVNEYGKIYAPDKTQLVVNENQIVATEPLPDQPLTTEQHRLAIYGAIGTVVFIGLMVLVLAAF